MGLSKCMNIPDAWRTRQERYGLTANDPKTGEVIFRGRPLFLREDYSNHQRFISLQNGSQRDVNLRLAVGADD